jgi:hypothetical protein
MRRDDNSAFETSLSWASSLLPSLTFRSLKVVPVRFVRWRDNLAEKHERLELRHVHAAPVKTKPPHDFGNGL